MSLLFHSYYDPSMPAGPGGPPYSQQGPPPSYHPYNMMPPGPPGTEMWAPDSKPMMNPAMLPMGQGPQSLPGGPAMGPPGPMNQGPQSFNQGPGPQQLGQMGQIRPMQPDMGMMGPGMPNNRLSMGPNNPPGPMNPSQMNAPGSMNHNAAQMNPAGPMNPASMNPTQMPSGPMNPNLPHAPPMSQQPFQGQGLQSGGPHSLPPPQPEVKNEDNTAELISFD